MNNRIDGAGRINNDIKINLTGIKDNVKTTVNSTFGDGFAVKDTGFVSVDSRFQSLAAKFDFEAPKYPKGGFAQFNPTESDYQTMKHLDGVLDCPEQQYCET